MPAPDHPGSPCPWALSKYGAQTVADSSPTPLLDGANCGAAPVVIARPKSLVKLDLACGQRPRDGYEGVDVWKGAKHVLDLLTFPWPWKDDSVDAIYCSHFIEHIPMETVGDGRLRAGYKKHLGKDLLFAFFDECYRILVPGGEMHVICPNARSNRAFQDPTHRRFIVSETFFYLSRDWRTANSLDHYNVECNFGGNVNPIIPAELTLLHPEAQAVRFHTQWNAIMDWDAKMKAIKG